MTGQTTDFGRFAPASATPAFLKVGVYGDPGSGKTYTASLIARGLALRIGKPPVLFLDTEGGSAWVRPIFEKAGVQFRVWPTRSFADLKEAVAIAERTGSILMIDSVTHFWEELREGYLAAKRERLRNKFARLELPDWNAIKPAWGAFTTMFLNSKVHILLCGRGASVYEFQEREGDGKKEMITAGTRMAAEKGLGYEPSLLIEMTQRQAQGPRQTKTVVRTATVLKDRADVLDGLQFDDPTFENFLPHIERLNIGGTHVAIDTDSSRTEQLFPTEGGGRDTNAARRLVVLDDTKDLLLKHIPGQTQADKVRKMEFVRKHFGCGWVEAEELLSLDKLKAGFASLKAELVPAPQQAAEKPVDEIPHLAAAAPETAAGIDDRETIIRDFIAAAGREKDAAKRKALWDETENARASMTDEQVVRLRAAYEQMEQIVRKPAGKAQKAEAA